MTERSLHSSEINHEIFPRVEAPSVAPATAPLDPFDLSRLRVRPDYVETSGVKRLLTDIPVGKPGKHTFFRVHPDPAYREDLCLFTFDDDRDATYLVPPEYEMILPSNPRRATLYLTASRQGDLRLWPVALRTGGRSWPGIRPRGSLRRKP